MKTGHVWIGSIVLACALGVAGTMLFRPKAEAPPPPLIVLEKMGHLVSVKVEVADVVEFTQTRTFDIPWTLWQVPVGGTKVLLIVKGDCLVATDLRQGTYEEVDAAKRSVRLVLPTPSVLQARVNHAAPEQGGTRLYAVTNQGIEALIPGQENRLKAIEAAMTMAQKKVEEAGKSAAVLRTAQESAEFVLKGTYAAIGWTVDVRWKPPQP